MRQHENSNQNGDILAFDKSGQLVLIVEVKNKRGTSVEWAKRMRRNMYALDLKPMANYCLLALPDKFYLWKNAGEFNQALEPTVQIDPTPFLQSYYDESGVAPGELSGDSFELIVAAWLNEILRTDIRSDLEARNQEWLLESGLFDSLVGGRLELEDAA